MCLSRRMLALSQKGLPSPPNPVAAEELPGANTNTAASACRARLESCARELEARRWLLGEMVLHHKADIADIRADSRRSTISPRMTRRLSVFGRVWGPILKYLTRIHHPFLVGR